MKSKQEVNPHENQINFLRVDFRLEAILDAKVSKFGTGGHIIVPSKYVNREAKVIILGEIKSYVGKTKNNDKKR